MDDSWWGPTIPLSETENYFCLSERSLPGSIMVNAEGERFTNEAAPYHDVVNDMYRKNVRGEKITTWLLTDQEYRNRYLFKDTLPGFDLPKSWYENGAVVKADTLAELAAVIGMEESQLTATVERFNGFAETGVDEDFSRGDDEYSRYYSDPSIKPNPSLAKIDQGPFYAYKIVPGDIGTKGGLVTDANSRVISTDGEPIRGLYAAGNASNGVMGRSYAGAGSTIGPAMTFAYVAAKYISKNKNS
jgi:3-oxosteroid 1-dehydrogenase